MTTAVAAPFRFFPLQVVRTRRLGPSLVRITFCGDALRDFASGGRDQSLSLFLPHPGQPEPVVPVSEGDRWWQAWRDLPADVRAVMRSYTVRAQRHEPGGAPEVDIDFALHGTNPSATAAAGSASHWAARAVAGDRVLVLGPAVADNSGVRFRPPEGTDLACVSAYQDDRPELADKFLRYDMFAPEFALSCLNRLQLRNNREMVDLADPSGALQLVGTLKNPIA